MKRCTACGCMKPKSEFSPRKDRPGQVQNKCRPCKAAEAREWRATKGEAYLEYKRARYAAAPTVERARTNQWRANNPDKRRAQFARYKAQRMQATPAWADSEKIKAFYTTADALGMLTGEWHHVDHIVPLRSRRVCGLHVEANLRVITATENQSKGNRHWPDMP